VHLGESVAFFRGDDEIGVVHMQRPKEPRPQGGLERLVREFFDEIAEYVEAGAIGEGVAGLVIERDLRQGRGKVRERSVVEDVGAA